jgi:glycine cleavage system H protein
LKFKRFEIEEGFLYTREHEWAKVSNSKAKIGITDYAAKKMNDIVYVTLPKLGQHIKQFEVIGTVESVKAVSEIYSPFSGTVIQLNEQLESHPELINKSPYSEGWLIEIELSSYEIEKNNLLTAEEYSKYLEELGIQ